MSTIFACSSGAAPAGIAVIRVSGPRAGSALVSLCGSLPEERLASLRVLKDADGLVLDRALVLWFPGPDTVTGEDLAEFHVHGGRAVIAAVERALSGIPGLEPAQPGEFTRRGFANGRMDLTEAEGLADLLSAETEFQRVAAIAITEGALSRHVENWRIRVLALSAKLEALLDFDDEDDVDGSHLALAPAITGLTDEMRDFLDAPAAETIREGFRVALAGPPNAGKSTLFNALVDREAAITSAIAGTTRDVLTSSVAIEGIPFTFVDMAGLRDRGDDSIEAIGIERARSELATADIVLWLGSEGSGPDGAWEIQAQCDRPDHVPKKRPRHRISARTGAGLDDLRRDLLHTARKSLSRPDRISVTRRQRSLISSAVDAADRAAQEQDALLIGEELRQCRLAFDQLAGRSSTEDMLDALFGRFCIGK